VNKTIFCKEGPWQGLGAMKKANEDWFVNLLNSAQKKLDDLLDNGTKEKRGGVRGEVYDTFLKKLAHPSNALVFEAMKVREFPLPSLLTSRSRCLCRRLLAAARKSSTRTC
jgi:hypothetical protein